MSTTCNSLDYSLPLSTIITFKFEVLVVMKLELTIRFKLNLLLSSTILSFSISIVGIVGGSPILHLYGLLGIKLKSMPANVDMLTSGIILLLPTDL